MSSTPQAATLDQMSRTNGSNMIVRSTARRFNEMDGHLTTDYSRQNWSLWLDLKAHRVDSCCSKCVPSFDCHKGAVGGVARPVVVLRPQATR